MQKGKKSHLFINTRHRILFLSEKQKNVELQYKIFWSFLKFLMV